MVLFTKQQFFSLCVQNEVLKIFYTFKASNYRTENVVLSIDV